MARYGNLNVFEKDFLRRKAVFLITSEIECYAVRKNKKIDNFCCQKIIFLEEIQKLYTNWLGNKLKWHV